MRPHFARRALECGGASHRFPERVSKRQLALSAQESTATAAPYFVFENQTETGKHFARSALDCGGASHRFLARHSKRQLTLPHSKALRAKRNTSVVELSTQYLSMPYCATAEAQAETGNHFARSALDCGGASHRFLARHSKRQLALPHSKALRAKQWRGAA
jgi:hypothetical protein